jgi:hypothetical protein
VICGGGRDNDFVHSKDIHCSDSEDNQAGKNQSSFCKRGLHGAYWFGIKALFFPTVAVIRIYISKIKGK